MTAIDIVPITDIDFLNRALILDEALMSSVNVQAQKIEVALVKRLRIDAPWMLPKLLLKS